MGGGEVHIGLRGYGGNPNGRLAGLVPSAWAKSLWNIAHAAQSFQAILPPLRNSPQIILSLAETRG